MKATYYLLLLLAAASLAQANLVITEVMSSSGSSNNATEGDWFELTNTGVAAVNLENYYWDDNGPSGNDGALFPAVTIGAGESIVIVEQDLAELPAWRTAWGISDTIGDPNYVNVLSKEDFGGPDDFSGLSSGGDQIQVWDADPNAGPANEVASVTFGSATAGLSFEWAINGTSLGTSVDGENQATTNTEGDIGSPGEAVDTSGPIAPSIDSPLQAYGRVFVPIDFDGFEITASDPNFGDALSFSTSGTPAWLTATDQGDGTLSLTGTPLVADVYTFDVTVTDDSASALSSTETITLFISSDNNPVLVNEYNAVESDNFLNGGDASQDSEGGTASDTFFGRIEGNGGDWFELVVVGLGNDGDANPATPVTPVAGSSVDMRGWRIEIQSGGDAETIVLSQAAYWASVPAGTLLTFTESNTKQGGLDTAINKTSDLSGDGYAWSNVWIHDPFFIDQGLSDFGGGIVIDNSDTNLLIYNSSAELVYGPAGEGVNPASGVGSDEIFKLEQDPTPAIDTVFGNYQDGESSSFGGPNEWSGGNSVQAFGAFQTGNTPPQFDSAPVTFATGGSYSYTISVSDPDGGTPTLSADALPSFLSLSGNTLSNNRPLTLDDAGEHAVELSVSDGTYTTPQKFMLTVYNPAPTIILNEYNAVSGSNFLGGGDALMDDNGGTASDSFFGRVAGNGGDWLELVVVGDGLPGTSDLRGTVIEVGTPGDDGSLDVSATLVLSNAPAWAAVEHGTILTFTEDNTANGGRDSGLKIVNNRSSDGWVWTNVWLGDTTLLDYTDEATNGYDLSALPDVSGLAIDEADTQVRILDGFTRIVFGPAGEGVAPASGVSATNVFELEADPTPAITPLDDATVGPAFLGYDDGASGSTFGAPNEWQQGGGGASVTQDFSPYIAQETPYEVFISGLGFSGSDAAFDVDPVSRGYSNGVLYATGGFLPEALNNAAATPQVQFTLRQGLSDATVIVQWTDDLGGTWTNLTAANEASFSVDVPEVGFDTFIYDAPETLVDAPAQFFRLHVTQN